MTILNRSLLVSIALMLLLSGPSVASAASATIQNLSSANPLAKTSVTFTMNASGFTVPIYQMADSFSGTSINSGNMNFGGNFQWVPNVSDIGTHNLIIQVTDSEGHSATATQIINVLPPPSISIQSVSPGSSVMPGATYSFAVLAPGFTNPTYFASDSFSGTSVSNNSITSGGNFTWVPNATQNGEHAITIYATDTAGHNAQATVMVRVGTGATLTAPSNVNTTLSPGQQITFTVTSSGYTPNGFSASDTFSGASTISNANINSSGMFLWTPSGSDAGVHVVTFIGQVGSYGQSASTTMTINVLGPNGVLPVSPIATTAAQTGQGSSAAELLKQLALLQSRVVGSSQTTASVGSNYIFTSYLKQGSENDEVMELQNVLQKLGHLRVAPNGYFGPSTVAAVKKFQTAHGLDPLGAVGPGTRLELNSLTSSGAASTQVTTQTTTSVSNNPYVFEHFMGVGDDDETDILELQKRLVSLGFLKAAPTGYYGAGTEAAVKKFQTKHGLPATGYVAKNTRAVLNAQ